MTDEQGAEQSPSAEDVPYKRVTASRLQPGMVIRKGKPYALWQNWATVTAVERIGKNKISVVRGDGSVRTWSASAAFDVQL